MNDDGNRDQIFKEISAARAARFDAPGVKPTFPGPNGNRNAILAAENVTRAPMG